MSKILAINGSYRDDGITDQTVHKIVQALVSAGAEVEIILLRESLLSFVLIVESAHSKQVIHPVNVYSKMEWRNWSIK